jgi:EAL domain-containing protein (putative c-di-GMP-specific phosphodiesterase class I)
MLNALRQLFSREAPEVEAAEPVTLESLLDRGWLELFYQPKIDLRTRRLVGAEGHFGAGYSSLARLRQLPFSELKIDRSYAANCHMDRFNAGVCETIVELAGRFGLRTVAEGIESNHEAHNLQGMGCELGQGYLFAKPMPKQQLLGIVHQRLKPLTASRSRQGSAWVRRVRA